MIARLNPFASDVLDGLEYCFTDGSLEDLLRRLEEQSWRGEITGPHGSGKTTLLNTVRAALERRGAPCRLLRFNESLPPCGRLLQNIPGECVMLIDGAEQLSWWQWRVLRRQARSYAGLIVTAHRPLGMPFRYECRPSLDVLEHLCAIVAGKQAFPKSLCTEMFTRCRGDIRAALRALYDYCWDGGAPALAFFPE